MDNTLSTKVDYIVRKIASLDQLVDAVAGGLLPKAKAQAACGTGVVCGWWEGGECARRCYEHRDEIAIWKYTYFANPTCATVCVETICMGWFYVGMC